MKCLFINAAVYLDGEVRHQNMMLDGVILSAFSGDASMANCPVFYNTAIFPGFCDVHVHLREPGFSYKETIRSGTMAAARGGYTDVLSMPNLNPVPDTREHLGVQLDIIRKSAEIRVHPYGAITKCEAGIDLADLEDMSEAIAFSDDGKGVQSEQMMKEAMLRAKALGKMIVAHCEDNSLLFGGYIHDGEYAKKNGHRGICSESEWGPIKRDIELVKETGCAYHVCHISTAESVELIRAAKAEGVNITCETGPHYLTLDEGDLTEDARFKMNPPLRTKRDRLALIDGVLDGTIDMIATDHAPHSEEEKSKGLEKSAMGVVGIETAFPVLYTDLVKTGVISLSHLVKLLTEAPRKRFGLNDDPGFTVFDLSDEYEINPNEFLSSGRSTPFEGKKVYGRCLLTVCGDRAVYLDPRLMH